MTSGGTEYLTVANEDENETFDIPITVEDAWCMQVNRQFSHLLVLSRGSVEVFDFDIALKNRSLETARIGTIKDESISVSAFFVGSTTDIVTAHWDNRVVRWRWSNEEYIGKQILASDYPVRYAEPNADGSRAIIMIDVGFGQVASYLYSFDARSQWYDLASNYKWIGVAFERHGHVIFRSSGIFEGEIKMALIPSLSELTKRAEGALSFGCAIDEDRSYETSTCWPDLGGGFN